MIRYQILIEYVGTYFIGWQTQKKGNSVQKVIQNVISKLLKERIKLRTKAVRNIDNYDNKVWIGDIPESKYCEIEPWIKNSSANSDEELNDKWIKI